MLTENSLKLEKGSKVIYETLKNLGVDTIFGYPGGIVLDLYNELYEQADIKHILTRHEQSAVHAAEGYARETGKCGVVLVTSGPGATNTVSGIVNAYMDGYPIVVITGQVFRNLIGKNAFQEANICDMVKSCTKKVYQITSAGQIQQVLKDAFIIANSGKKGPVVVDIVKDVFQEKITFDNTGFSVSETINKNSDFDISGIVKKIISSQKPVIVSGGGVKHSKAEDELLKISEKYSIPVVNTMMGLGTFPQSNKNYLGMIGIFGDNAANEIVEDSDLVISLGARFNDRILCKFNNINLSEKFIQIDINKSEISNFVKASEFVVADIKEFLKKLDTELERHKCSFENREKQIPEFKRHNTVRTRKSNMLHSFEVIRKIEEFTKGKELTFTTEVGQHQLWAVQNLNLYKNRKIFVSGASGTMGFGLPAAIGAAAANPDKNIVCITGDGSFQMGLHELATCKDYNLNIKIMILNNGYLGMVRQLQEKFCNARYSETKISNPDFVTLAKSYGLNAERVTNIENIDTALKHSFETNGTYLIDFVVEPMEVL